MKNKILVNADDFGLEKSFSDAIIEAFEKNFISSTTACGNGADIERAALLAKEKGFVERIGIHVNFTEGKPLTDEIARDPFFCENGEFHGKINRLKRLTKSQIAAIKKETQAQIDRLRELGLSLSHADSHHHIHTAPFFTKAIVETLRKNGIEKIRLHRNVGKIAFYKKIVKYLFNKKLKKQGFATTDYFGGIDDFVLQQRKTDEGLCEIMTHPDYDKEGVLVDRVDFLDGYAVGEPLEKILSLLDGKELVSYEEVK